MTSKYSTVGVKLSAHCKDLETVCRYLIQSLACPVNCGVYQQNDTSIKAQGWSLECSKSDWKEAESPGWIAFFCVSMPALVTQESVTEVIIEKEGKPMT